MSHAFPARYRGRCAECHLRIEAGDEIRMTDDGPVHDACAPTVDALELRSTDIVCPDCYTIKPCRCDD